MENGLKIGVIGLGVVGLNTASQLHELGHTVYANDLRSPEEIEGWNNNFKFMPVYSIKETDATFLILPTPSTEEVLYKNMNWEVRRHIIEGRFNEGLDLRILEGFCQQLGEELKVIDKYHLFVIRSTVEPGFTRAFGRRLEEISGKRLGEEFGVAMIPEFLRAYRSAEDTREARLLVAGCLDDRSLAAVKVIYANLPRADDGGSRIYPMIIEEAEYVKLESNAINAIWISLHNARLANYEMIEEKTGIPIDYNRMTTVLKNMTEALYSADYGTSAGLFYGGTCLKKDPGALLSWLQDKHRIFSPFSSFIELGMHVNTHYQKRILNDHIFPNTLKGGLPERLKNRNHETYDNVKKVLDAMASTKALE